MDIGGIPTFNIVPSTRAAARPEAVGNLQDISANAPAKQAATTASQAQFESQIAQQVASAGSGASVDVQYRYSTGPDGALIVSGAEVTITREVPSSLTALTAGAKPQQNLPAATGSSARNIRDIVDISGNSPDQFGLNDGEREQVRRLQAADSAVRQHEGLHFRASAGLGSLPEYQTVTGPDGKQYAVGGSVGVSGTRGADPEKAAREAQTLVLAATAPGDASAQDLSAARQFSAAGSDASQAVNASEKAQNISNAPAYSPVNIIV